MNSIYEINKDIVYVKGALNGAIYDFNTSKVYSINDHACNIIDEIISPSFIDTDKLSSEKKDYIKLLHDNKLLFNNLKEIHTYIPYIDKSINLSLAWLEITQACNLKCVHCYEGEDHIQSKNSMNLDKWITIIDELNALNIDRAVIIGGEPCAYKDIKNLLLYISKFKFDITLFTNATLLTKDLMDIIIANNIKVKVSLYGHNSDVHDLITSKKGSFDILIENIKYLIDNGATVNFSVIGMKENQEYMEEIKHFIQSLGIEYKGYDVIRNVHGGTQSIHTPTKEELLKRSTLSKPSFVANKERFNSNSYINSCWYGKFAITEVGEVIPCVFERNISYGNVNSYSLEDILQSQNLKDNWFKDFSKIDTCKDCEYRFACKDCRPLGLSVSGNENSKNPRCKYNPYTGEWC